jgi:antitoxin component YwqK of YwqJK toxin-antitoxin module
MKKIALAVFALLYSIKSYSQVDTSYFYYNIFGDATEKGAADLYTTQKVFWQNAWFVYDYYANGKPKSKMQFKDAAYMIAQDTLYEYHENGQLAEKGLYNNGNKVGVWLSWFDDGKPNSKCTYKDDSTSKCVYYHYNGEVSAAVEYKNDSILLKARMWDSTGVPSANEYLSIAPTLYGFENGWKRFVTENMKFPEDEDGKRIKANVSFWIKIDRFGKVHWGDVIGFSHPYLALELERLINKMPLWTPAINQNRPVDYILSLNLSFNSGN